MQEACTIIQSAAHEDANIIFGAVMEDKMKDAVKITVIATGFRDSDVRRRRMEHDAFPAEVFSEHETESELESESESDPLPPPPPMVMEPVHVETRTEAQVSELDAMRSAMIAKLDQGDLDLPTFLRKRSEPI